MAAFLSPLAIEVFSPDIPLAPGSLHQRAVPGILRGFCSKGGSAPILRAGEGPLWVPLHFPDDSHAEPPVHTAFFEEMSIQVLCPVLTGLVFCC
jgi:hypothetical protein